jgi:uncharacterized protein (TIGR03066 family)
MSAATKVSVMAGPTFPVRRLWRAWWLLLIVFFSAFVTYAVGEYLLAPRIPTLMLGKWVVVEGQFQGSTVEFSRDGSMVSNLKKDGAIEKIEGEVSLDGIMLKVTTHDRVTGKKTTDELTILELSDEMLVTQDDGGRVLMMRRG